MEGHETYYSSRDVQGMQHTAKEVEQLREWQKNSIHFTSHGMICNAYHEAILFVVEEYLSAGGDMNALKAKYETVKPKGGLFNSEIFEKPI